MLFLYFLVGYCALYAVIWLHEVGHGIVYARYQCKDNPFKVHVPFYLFFSTPQPVNLEKAQYLTKKQDFHVGMGGIIVNLIFGLPLASFFFTTEFTPSILNFFIFAFTLFHLVEAATYLTISNIFLASDIISVQNYKPKLRIPLFIVGVCILVLILYLILKSPHLWQVGFIISVIITISCMGLGRMIFSRRVQAS